MTKKIKIIFPLLVILAASFLLFGKDLIPPEGKMIYGADEVTQYYFFHQYVAQTIKTGRLPFWNPYFFSGFPFFPLTMLHPGMLVHLLFPANTALSLYYFLHINLAGIFMYLSLRKKLDRISSLFGAVVFAFGGHIAGKIYLGHTEWVVGIAYIPLIFFSGVYILEGIYNSHKKQIISSSLIFIISLVIQLLTVTDQLVLITLEVLALYLIYSSILVLRKKEGIKKSLMGIFYLSILIIFSIGLAAFRIIPFAEFALNDSTRISHLASGDEIIFSATKETLRLFIDPWSLGSPFSENYSYRGPGDYFVYIYFAGRLPLILIALFGIKQLMSLVTKRKIDRYFLFFVLAIIVFLVFALGKNSPIFDLTYTYFPLYHYVRGVSRYLIIVVFLIAAISSYVLSRFKSGVLKVLAIVIILAELLPFHRAFIRMTDTPQVVQDSKLVEFLSQNIGNNRLYTNYATWSYLTPKLELNSGLLTHIPTISGYSSLILGRYTRFIDAVNKTSVPSYFYLDTETERINPWSPKLNFLNAKYILNESRYDSIGHDIEGRFKKVLAGDGYNLYENLNFLPRFFFTSNMAVYPDLDSLDEAIRNDETDLSQTIYVLRSDLRDIRESVSDCNGRKDVGEVSSFTNENEKIILSLKANCDSFLSTSEVYYPGWKAELDGKEVKIYRSNLAFRTVRIPKGDHKLVMEYVPFSFRIGLFISIATGVLMLIVFYIFFQTRKH